MLGMKGIWVTSIILSILILGILGLSQDVFSAIFTVAFDVSGQESIPFDLAFNADGTKMFVLGVFNDEVNEYACTTGFDVSTCSFTVKAGNPFSVAAQGNQPLGLAFNTAGTKMFVVENVGDDVNEYACTTGFDVSTCAFTVKAGNPFSVAAQDNFPEDLAFNTDGTKMFVLGNSGDDVNEYACGTGFDVSTCAYSGDDERFSVFFQEQNPRGLAFNTDGTKMFVLGTINRDVNEYSLPIAFDVSSVPPCKTCADFNGDGFDDLAIGVAESLAGSIEGAVNIIYGSASGLHKNLGRGDQFFHQDALKIEDTAETGDNFGVVLAVGNFNNDLYDDLVIGVPFEDLSGIGEGAVNVIYGSAKALHKGLGHIDQFWTQDSLKIADTAENFDNFGLVLTVGDFNNDGFHDLAIGVPNEDLSVSNEGAVNVIYGSAKALHKGLGHADQFWTQDSLKIEDTAQISDNFGSALTAGDFNGDGS